MQLIPAMGIPKRSWAVGREPVARRPKPATLASEQRAASPDLTHDSVLAESWVSPSSGTWLAAQGREVPGRIPAPGSSTAFTADAHEAET